MTVYDCDDPDQRATGIREAAYAVRRGDLIVLPTDTVYGIGADAFTPSAVTALLAAKGRGRDMPVPVLIGSRTVLDALVGPLSEPARHLVEVLWPGALTIVVRHNPALAWDLGDARGTVALRMPADLLGPRTAPGDRTDGGQQRESHRPAAGDHLRERAGPTG